VVGAVGARVDAAGALGGVERAAAVLAGALMIIWAISVVVSSLGARLPTLDAPTWIRRQLGAVILSVRDRPPVVRAALTGFVTPLVPCGWLYTFVLTAGGTGRPLAGGLVMAAFWIGTVPMMLGVGFGRQRTIGPLARRLPLAGATLVFVLGVLSIAGMVRAPL
jgi:sulfite exporter TauE/SafE